MNIEFAESFNDVATADIGGLTTSWIDSGMSIGAFGRGGTNGLQMTQRNGSLTQNFSQPLSEVGIAFSFDVTSFTANDPIARLLDGVNHQISVTRRSDGLLDVRRGTSTGTILLTSISPYNDHDHFYLRVVIDGANGVLELRRNGVLDQPIATGLNTQNTANNTTDKMTIGTGGGGFTQSWRIDDWYIANALDGNSDFPGDIHFKTRTPNGAGDSSAWTPLAGANYTNVDEATPNGDTDYIEATGASKDDLYTGTAVTGTGAVRCVVVRMVARKPEGGVAVLRGIVKVGGTIYESADRAPAVDYRMLRGIIDNVSALDTVAEANSCQFGPRKVS